MLILAIVSVNCALFALNAIALSIPTSPYFGLVVIFFNEIFFALPAVANPPSRFTRHSAACAGGDLLRRGWFVYFYCFFFFGLL